MLVEKVKESFLQYIREVLNDNSAERQKLHTHLSGNSFLRRLNSSSMVSRGLSLISSIFSQPMTCINIAHALRQVHRVSSESLLLESDSRRGLTAWQAVQHTACGFETLGTGSTAEIRFKSS